MDEGGGGGLLGLACGIGLGMWATVGHGGVVLGVLAVLVIVASIAWLSALGF